MHVVTYTICVLCFLSLGGCKNHKDKGDKISESKPLAKELQFPLKMNVLEKYNKKTLDLEEIADLEYIPLETCKNALLSNRLNGLFLSDSLIVGRNQLGTILVFNRSGRFLYEFNHTGRGPGEYKDIIDFAVDEEAGEIYVCDHFMRYKIWVYSLAGVYKRSLNIVPLWVSDIINYDKDHLLVYMKMSPSRGKKHMGLFYPYGLMSKVNGTVKQLNMGVTEMKDGRLHQTYESKPKYHRGRVVGYQTSPLIRNGESFYISDFASDTLFSFHKGILSPFIIFVPSLQNLETAWFVGITAKTSRYTFLSVVKGNEKEMKLSRRWLGVDHKTGEIFEPDFKNNCFIEVPENYFLDLPMDCAVISIPALKLIEAYQKGELTGKLKEIASNVKEDDNPVLMLIKFKK